MCRMKALRKYFTPKALHNTAQGRRAAAHPGRELGDGGHIIASMPKGSDTCCRGVAQGRRCAATWAVLCNAFGVKTPVIINIVRLHHARWHVAPSPHTPPFLPRLCRRSRLRRADLAAARWPRNSGGADGSEAATVHAAQERHLPLHGRRTQPAGAVRSQAEARPAAQPTNPGGVCQRQALRLHGHLLQGTAQAPCDEPEVRAARPGGIVRIRVPTAHRRHR